MSKQQLKLFLKHPVPFYPNIWSTVQCDDVLDLQPLIKTKQKHNKVTTDSVSSLLYSIDDDRNENAIFIFC